MDRNSTFLCLLFNSGSFAKPNRETLRHAELAVCLCVDPVAWSTLVYLNFGSQSPVTATCRNVDMPVVIGSGAYNSYKLSFVNTPADHLLFLCASD